MAKKSAAKPKAETTEPEIQTPAEPTITKSEASRRAIAEGLTNAAEAVAFIKSKFGLDMSPAHFAAVRSGEKKKTGETKAKPGPKPKAAVESAHPVATKKADGEGDLLASLETLKPLIAQLGAAKVRRLVDLLD